MKLKFVIGAVFFIVLLIVLASTVQAQSEPPPPYAGLKNPFPWDNTTAQEIGKKLYQQSCLGCHGVKGNGLSGFDFSSADFQKDLEIRADYHYWILSEGRLDRGMPPFKSSFSDEQRWQVLTYLWSLGKNTTSSNSTPKPPEEQENVSLLLTAFQQPQAGQPLTLSATLKDDQGKPIEDATIEFFFRADFFAKGLMELGEAATDSQGVAVFEYAPRRSGEVEVVARYKTAETATILTLPEANEPFYQTEVGIKFPSVGEDFIIGPDSSRELGAMGEAPMTALYLPGGILSWLWVPVIAIIVVWSTYLRIMNQVLHIPVISTMGQINTRLVPMLAMAAIVGIGILLVLMIITGPYTHFNLLPAIK